MMTYVSAASEYSANADVERAFEHDKFEDILQQIVYFSRAAIWMNRDGFGVLVKRAIANNMRTDITGLVIFDGCRFLQAIEGPEAQMTACMARVRTDPRHHTLNILSVRETDDRQFGTFAMAAMMPGLISKQTFLHEIKAAVALVHDSQIQAMFIGFAVLA